MPIVGLTDGPDSTIEPLFDSNKRIPVTLSGDPEIRDGYHVIGAGNSSPSLGLANQLFKICSAMYSEQGAATPAVRLYTDTESLAMSPTITATANAVTDLECTACIAGDDVIKCANGAAGDFLSITAYRLA